MLILRNVRSCGHASLTIAGRLGLLVFLTGTALAQIPLIAVHPAEITVDRGESATFSVTVSGGGDLTYQWRKHGVAVPAATSSSYVLPNVQPADVGTFSVVVANAGGTVVSEPALLRVVTGPAFAFTTFAGYVGYGFVDGPLGTARFYDPRGVAADAAGNVYVADTFNHAIRQVAPDGIVSTFAGLGGVAGSADGEGGAARFNAPLSITVAPDGQIYVSDANNHTIRKISASGSVTTIAGLAGVSGSEDGSGASARFKLPAGLVVNSAGDVFVADTYNFTIRKITADRLVSTLAGKADIFAGTTDGVGANARFGSLFGIALDPSGNLVVGDSGNSTVRRVTMAGVVTTIAGSPGVQGSADGTGSNARFSWPTGVAVDSAGNVFVGEKNNRTIRRITAAGVVTTLAGWTNDFGSADGTGLVARFGYLYGLCLDASGHVLAADGFTGIRKVSPLGVVTTIAGAPGSPGYANGPATVARFRSPIAVTSDGAGGLYVCDNGNRYVRRVTAAGVVSLFASGFMSPRSILANADGTVDVADSELHVVKRISSTGAFTIVAGRSGFVGAVDGTGAAASFHGPHGLARDGAGNVYVADTVNHTLRKISPAGVVTTVAGSAGLSGSADGNATSARFRFPSDVSLDAAGNLLVTDSGNHTVRMVSPSGVVTTLAGVAGVAGFTDGLGSLAQFSSPQSLVSVASGDLFVTDVGNQLIRRISRTGRVVTIAGTAGVSGSADGIGPAARFYNPFGITTDSSGALFVADTLNSIIRRGTAVPVPQFTAQPASQAAIAGAPVSFSAAVSAVGPVVYQWRRNGVKISGATALALAISPVRPEDAGSYDLTATNPSGTVSSQLAVLLINSPPVISAVSSARFILGRPGSVTFVASGSPLPTWSVSSGVLPAWATLNPATGVLTGTPPDASGAPFTFTLTAANGIGSPVTQTFSLTVQLGHSADVSPADGALNLAELTRVIELYNTRTGTLRTGRYVTAIGSVDGFAPDPSVTAGPIPTAPHSADLNRDGRLSLTELTRVLELFTTRTGTTRTGAYRPQSATEDGFAPGP